MYVFDNQFLNHLPADPEQKNFIRQVHEACYSRVEPIKVSQPSLVAYSKEVAEQLGFTQEFCLSENFVQVFSGNQQLDGMQPYAMCYGGHQFGNWAGQLGDGRAINLGELVNSQGQRFILQLKGAGPTPYSRSADGLAVLRSSIREFLCSEAMHHLGVPTTRALSVVLTGEQVVRDMFYDGNPEPEPGAIVCRVSPTFTRFGSFEIFTSRGETEILKQLVDYTITTDFPHLGGPGAETYLRWFNEVCERTAILMTEWMRVGFVHGVMNTDNMSITGLTIDYGPYGWLENYDPDWTPNTTDAQGKRYRYGHQPHIAQWNLFKLANAIYPLIQQTEPLQDILNNYAEFYNSAWQQMMTSKLGLSEFQSETDEKLTMDLLNILKLVETDMTLFFRKLAQLDTDNLEISDEELLTPLLDAYYVEDQLTDTYKSKINDWLRRYRKRLSENSSSNQQRVKLMNSVNPKYVMRNYLAQLAIDKSSEGDHSLVNELLDVMRRPYDEQPEKEKFAEKRPDWARHRPGCSMLSCSS